MPIDIGLESDILAAVLADSRLVGPLLRLLEAEDFASPKGRRLFDAVASVAKRDGRAAVAPATVRAELQRVGTDEREVLDIMDPLLGIGAVGSFEPKCRRLRDVRRQTEILRRSQEVLGESDIEEALAKLQELSCEVARLGHRDEATLADVIDELLDERERDLALDLRIKTGLPTLDDLLGGGFAPGWFVVVGARTGVGKTTLGVQVTWNALRAGRRVLYISLEESRTQIVERIIRHGRRLLRVRPGAMDPLFAVAMEADIREMPLIVESANDLEPMLSSIAQRVQETEGLGLVVVDYVGLVRTVRPENRVQEISEVTRRLKRAAMENRVPIIGVAQVNRSPMSRSDHRPMLSDLRDSGSLEQDADVVVLLHRASEITGREGTLRLAKSRYGPPAEFDVGFDYATGRIVEVSA